MTFLFWGGSSTVAIVFSNSCLICNCRDYGHNRCSESAGNAWLGNLATSRTQESAAEGNRWAETFEFKNKTLSVRNCSELTENHLENRLRDHVSVWGALMSIYSRLIITSSARIVRPSNVVPFRSASLSKMVPLWCERHFRTPEEPEECTPETFWLWRWK